ncbi:hypothetical protein O0L34_g18878 [Tuta absoluta]|nr:hypothetical protein O0L34_g18878 [Tuta absoluta]
MRWFLMVFVTGVLFDVCILFNKDDELLEDEYGTTVNICEGAMEFVLSKLKENRSIQENTMYCSFLPYYMQCNQSKGFASTKEICEKNAILKRCEDVVGNFKYMIEDTKFIQAHCKDFPTEYSQCKQTEGYAFANETCVEYEKILKRCKKIFNDFKDKNGSDTEFIQSHCKDFPTEYSQCKQVDGFAFANETCVEYEKILKRCKKIFNDFKDENGSDTEFIRSHCKDFPTEYSQCKQVDGFAFANETCVKYENLKRCTKIFNDFEDKIGKGSNTEVILSHCENFLKAYSQCEKGEEYAIIMKKCEYENLKRCKKIFNDFKDKNGSDTEFIQSHCKDFPTEYSQCKQVNGFAFAKETCVKYEKDLKNCKKFFNDFKDKIEKGSETEVILSHCEDFPRAYLQCEQVDGYAFIKKKCEKYANLKRCKQIFNDFKDKNGSDTEFIQSHCKDFPTKYSQCKQVDGFAFAKETCVKYEKDLKNCKKIFNDFKDKIGKGSDTKVILSHCEDFPRAYSQCEQVDGYAFIKKKCEKYANLKRCKKIFNDFKDKNGSDTEFIQSHCKDFPTEYSQCKQVDGFAFANETCVKYEKKLKNCKKTFYDFKDKIGKGSDTKVILSHCEDFPRAYSQCEKGEGYAIIMKKCENENLKRCKKIFNDFKDKNGSDTEFIHSHCKDFPTEYSQCKQVNGFAFAKETCVKYEKDLKNCKKFFNDFKDKIEKGSETEVILSHCEDFPRAYLQCEQVDGYAFIKKKCEKYANLKRCKQIFNDFKDKNGSDTEFIQSHCKDFPTKYSQCKQVDGFAFAKETCVKYEKDLKNCKKIFNDFKDKIGKGSDTKVILSHCEDFPRAYSQCEQVDGYALIKKKCEKYANLKRCKKIFNDFKDKNGSDTEFIQSHCKVFPTEYSQCKQVDGFAFANETCVKYEKKLKNCKKTFYDFKDKIGKGSDTEVILSHCENFLKAYLQCEKGEGYAIIMKKCENENLKRCKKIFNDFKDKNGSDTEFIQSHCKDFPTEYSQCKQVDGFAFANETCVKYEKNLKYCKKIFNDFKDKIGKGSDTEVILSHCENFLKAYSQCEKGEEYAIIMKKCEYENLKRCKQIFNDFKDKNGSDTEFIQSHCKDFPTEYSQCKQVDGFAFAKETCVKYEKDLKDCKKIFNDFKDKIGKGSDTEVILSHCEDFPRAYSQCEKGEGYAIIMKKCENENLKRCKKIFNDFKDKNGSDTEFIHSHCKDFPTEYSQCKQVNGFAFAKETCVKYEKDLKNCKKFFNDFKDKIEKGSETEVILSHCEDFPRAYLQCEQVDGYAFIKKKCEKYANLKRCKQIFNDFKDKNGSDTEFIQSHCKNFPTKYSQCKQVDGFAFAKETCVKYEKDLKNCKKIFNDFKDKIGKGSDTEVILSHCEDFPRAYSQCEQVDGYAFIKKKCEKYANLKRCKQIFNDFKDKNGSDTEFIQLHCKDFPTEYSQCKQVDGFAFANETCVKYENLKRCTKIFNDFKDKNGSDTQFIQSHCKDFSTEYSQCKQTEGFTLAKETCEKYEKILQHCKKTFYDFKDKIGKGSDTEVILSHCEDFPRAYSQCEQVDGYAFIKKKCEKYANLKRCKKIFNDFKDKSGNGSDTKFIQSHCKDFPTKYSQCKQVEGFALANETCEKYEKNLKYCKKIFNDLKDKIGNTQFIQSHCKDFPTEYSQCKQVEGFAFANETCEKYANLDEQGWSTVENKGTVCQEKNKCPDDVKMLDMMLDPRAKKAGYKVQNVTGVCKLFLKYYHLCKLTPEHRSVKRRCIKILKCGAMSSHPTGFSYIILLCITLLCFVI